MSKGAGKALGDARLDARQQQPAAGRSSAESDSDLKKHFHKYKWGHQKSESVSGPGSTLKYTRNLRQKLPGLLVKYGVKVFLDAPCGDFNWMREVALPGIKYIGMDIVDEIIKDNEKYGDENREFLVGDITADPLPVADMMMCRDCLFHLRFADSLRFFRNFAQHDIPYLLLTTHPDHTPNADLPVAGRWRMLNMSEPPFNLPAPLETIEDWIRGWPKRRLALWTGAQIREALPGMKVG